MPRLALAVLASYSVAGLALGEWNQWRGSAHTGICDDTTPIANGFPPGGIPLIWESEAIPSDLEGGHGSPVVSGNRVYLGVVWHTKTPSEVRLIDDEVLTSLGYRDTGLLGPELTNRMEDARRALSPRLRGDAREQRIQQWIKDNFNDEQQLILGSWCGWRFGQGREAVDLDLLAAIHKHVNKPFVNEAALEAWLEGNGIPPDVREKVIKAVPDTIRVAKDTMLCLDAFTGKTLWRFEAAGTPTGRMASSTCAAIDGRVYWLGSQHLYALDGATGRCIWQTEVKPAGGGSSPLVSDGKVWVMVGGALCCSAEDGRVLWHNPQVHGDKSSPILWTTSDGRTVLVCHTPQGLDGIDPETGLVAWQIEGGGESTPVANGDDLVILSASKGVGLRCYHAQPHGKPRTVWSNWWLAARHASTPVIYEGHVYLMEGGKHLCARLSDGAVAWEERVESTISSPVLVDGKLLSLDENGLSLRLIKADPTSYQLLGRTKVSAMWCPTPAPWNGRLVVRRKDRVVCFDLRPVPPGR